MTSYLPRLTLSQKGMTHSRRAARALFATALLCLASLVGCSSRPGVEMQGEVVGRSFPAFKGEALDGRVVNFPDAIRGKKHLLLVAYVQEAQFDVDRWVLGVLQAKAPVAILELPTIKSLGARLAKGFINRGMQRGIPKEDWPSVITIYGDASAVSSFVGDIPGNNACALLVDEKGIVRWSHREGYSPRELMDLVAVVQRLNEEVG